MLETRRVFHDTPALLILIVLSVFGVLLFFSGQLGGNDFSDFQAKNVTYHNLLQHENNQHTDYESIQETRQELTIQAILGDPGHYLYDVYKDIYPDYEAEKLDEIKIRNIQNEEWAYVQLEQQAAYQQAAYENLDKMEKEYAQKSRSKIFNKNPELIHSMGRTLQDYQKRGKVIYSYGDDRFVLSVLQNRSNIALLLILLFYGCYQLYLPKGQALYAVITSTRCGRRRLKASGLLCLCIWTTVSQLFILIPQFAVSYYLYDGCGQWNRTIQSLELFSDFLLPCSVLQFIALYIVYAVFLSCFVSVLIWSVMHLCENLGMAVLALSVLIWVSYSCYMMNGNSKYVFFKYCNLIACLVPMDLIRQYRLINMVGCLINISLLIPMAFTCFSIALAILTLVRAGKPYPSEKTNRLKMLFKGPRKRSNCARNQLPLLWEQLKLIAEGKHALALIAAVFFALSYQLPTLYLDDISLAKRAYYQQLDSMQPEEAESVLVDSLNATESTINNPVIDPEQQTDFVFYQMLRQYTMQKNVLENLISEAEEMKEFNKEHNHKEVFFDYYQTENLLCMGDMYDGKWRMLALLIIVIFLSSVCFPLEKQSGSLSLIISSPMGVTRTFTKKAMAVWLEVLLVILCFAAPEGIKLMKITPLWAAAQSVPCLKESACDVSIGGYWLLQWGCRLLILLGVSSVVMMFSFMYRTVYAGVVMAEGVFGLPNLLPVLFPTWNVTFLPISLITSNQNEIVRMILICAVGLGMCLLLVSLFRRKTVYRLIQT